MEAVCGVTVCLNKNNGNHTRHCGIDSGQLPLVCVPSVFIRSVCG